MRDMKTKRCGCVVFEVGPPVLCEEHQAKANRKVRKEKKREEKKRKLEEEERGLKKIAAKTAFDLGHDLSNFKEYESQRGKHTAYCHACGALVIVYDFISLGDQVAGPAVTQRCSGSSGFLRALRESPVADS